MFTQTSLQLNRTCSSFHNVRALDSTLLGENGQLIICTWTVITENSKIKEYFKKFGNIEKANVEISHTKEHVNELDSVLKITVAFYHFKKIVIRFNILEINSIEYIL